MNLWIDIAHDSLMRTIRAGRLLIVRRRGAQELTDEPNLVRAAREVLDPGRASSSPSRASTAPRCSPQEGFFGLPAYPLEDVVDPTGAGDFFAGGFLGFIAAHADEELSDELLRRAMAYGTALASFNVEAFGTERIRTLTAARSARPSRRPMLQRDADALAAGPSWPADPAPAVTGPNGHCPQEAGQRRPPSARPLRLREVEGLGGREPLVGPPPPLMKRIQAAWRASTESIESAALTTAAGDVRALAGIGGDAGVLEHLRGGAELGLVRDRVLESNPAS